METYENIGNVKNGNGSNGALSSTGPNQHPTQTEGLSEVRQKEVKGKERERECLEG